MADSSWFRFGQRSCAPNAPRSPTSPGRGPTRVPSHPSLTSRSSFSHVPHIGSSDTSLLVREQDKIWHSPSLNQMVDGLQVVIMINRHSERHSSFLDATQGILQPIPVEYNSHILHLIEGFVDAQERIRKVDIDRAEAKHSLEHHLEYFKAVADEWLEREHQYKTEIKRLEVLLSRTSRDGLEAVTLARANSVLDRDSPQAKHLVSKLKRLDSMGDIPRIVDKYMPGPVAKVLDRANDFFMSEKMRLQDATTNTTLAHYGNRFPRHATVGPHRPRNDALVTKVETEYPNTPARVAELHPLFSDDVFDVPNLDRKGPVHPDESTHQERRSRRHILENLLDCEVSQNSGKDTSSREKTHQRASIARVNQALDGPSIRSLDSRHLRGWSGVSGFSFVPGDDASPILVSSGASDETTIATPAEEYAINEEIVESRPHEQDRVNPMHNLGRPIESWETQWSPGATGAGGQESSTSNINSSNVGSAKLPLWR
ncbi:uncharacterized protein GGS22DRAFT_192672 [Annulohypoxylon maeteangense]|uniref:uncharacterized protein n=1 Tax=Annulohypoxylon maeteangense TaxID=1927788 RepID=UPI0020073670|nr:uncharacterized protein GGS22DRAFT_192672 [Annulohypoxylon maeteangense]KAI0881185.1 hypothetical protein GGS22DRAFT_192672 [Annulohypoxylon maeteangense]